MRLSALDLRHFRNLGIQRLDVPPEGVAIVGDNAQGKSNLLEAVYYLETFRSFRGSRDGQLVEFGQDVFRVAGTLVDDDGGEQVTVAAAFQRKGKRKKVTVDGTEPERMGDALGKLAAVVFSPADVELVSGSPGERRRFLDIALLSLSETGYLKALQDFKKILARRNAALKDEQPGSVVMAWDQGLVRTGAQVMKARQEWINGRCDAFREYYRTVSGKRGAHIEYRSSVSLDGAVELEEFEEAYRDALVDTGDRERRRGTTVVGPHRDEMRIRLEDGDEELDLRDYGSGGQRRTAALALRLVEARTIREVRGQEPIILLDDVFAELDRGRSERILHLMENEEVGQVLLTAPKESDVRIRRDALERWSIQGGVVTG